MFFTSFALAAAAAAQAAAPQLSPSQARAQGYAEAQAALARESGLTPQSLAASLSAAQGTAPAQAAPSPSTPVPSGDQLNLTCGGGGTANKATAATAWSSGGFSGHAGGTFFGGSTYGSTTVLGTRQQGFAEQVDVRLFGGDDRIRLPRTMLPPLHGGADGWFKLKNVQADARAIRASAAVNVLNNPKVYIDRVTGTISISGKSGDYSGQCEASRGDAPARF